MRWRPCTVTTGSWSSSASKRPYSGEHEAFSLEYRVHGPDGATRWLQAKCEVVKDEHDGGIRVVGATRDVTAQVAAGQELRRAENFWHAAIDSLSAHVAIVDEHGDIIAVNKAWRRFGAQRGAASDCLGANYFDACGSADDPYAQQATDGLREVLAGDRDEFSLEYPCPAPDGPRWFVMRVTPYQTSARRWAVVTHEDATARRSERAQVLLQAALLDEVDVSVHTTGIDRCIVSWNEGASRLFGWSAEEAIGQTIDELLVPADRADSGGGPRGRGAGGVGRGAHHEPEGWVHVPGVRARARRQAARR